MDIVYVLKNNKDNLHSYKYLIMKLLTEISTNYTSIARISSISLES